MIVCSVDETTEKMTLPVVIRTVAIPNGRDTLYESVAYINGIEVARVGMLDSPREAIAELKKIMQEIE